MNYIIYQVVLLVVIFLLIFAVSTIAFSTAGAGHPLLFFVPVFGSMALGFVAKIYIDWQRFKNIGFHPAFLLLYLAKTGCTSMMKRLPSSLSPQ